VNQPPPLQAAVSAVTERIRARSHDSRREYLERMSQAGRDGSARARLSCTNLAHGFAAAPPADKQALRQMKWPNIGIVTAYNDMLSAHQPFERYPALIRAAAREAGAQVVEHAFENYAAQKNWALKPLPLKNEWVLLLDADNVPVVDPEYLFNTPQFRSAGAIFWPDRNCGACEKAAVVWRSLGLRQPAGPEFETGQVLVDKQRCWRALCLALWLNENSDFYYQHLHGDKETFHLAFRKMKSRYVLVPRPMHSLDGTLCQHDFRGERIFQHRYRAKWNLLAPNRTVPDFRFEKECLDSLARLRRLWNGQILG